MELFLFVFLYFSVQHSKSKSTQKLLSPILLSFSWTQFGSCTKLTVGVSLFQLHPCFLLKQDTIRKLLSGISLKQPFSTSPHSFMKQWWKDFFLMLRFFWRSRDSVDPLFRLLGPTTDWSGLRHKCCFDYTLILELTLGKVFCCHVSISFLLQ